jgi:hypothetical protein
MHHNRLPSLAESVNITTAVAQAFMAIPACLAGCAGPSYQSQIYAWAIARAQEMHQPQQPQRRIPELFGIFN